MEQFIIDNIKILIFVGAAVLWVIGKIAEAKKKQQEPQDEPWSPEEDDGYDYEDERQPDFQPYHPAVPPPLPRAVAPPVLPAEDRELARQRAMQERLSALRKERTSVAKAARKPKMAKTTTTPTASPSLLKERLRNRTELRRAIVMREILDPPVGLR